MGEVEETGACSENPCPKRKFRVYDYGFSIEIKLSGVKMVNIYLEFCKMLCTISISFSLVSVYLFAIRSTIDRRRK